MENHFVLYNKFLNFHFLDLMLWDTLLGTFIEYKFLINYIV